MSVQVTEPIVWSLPDGRMFIADQWVIENRAEYLMEHMSNYWTRHETLDGFVSPWPEKERA